jgi:hypothetical protein
MQAEDEITESWHIAYHDLSGNVECALDEQLVGGFSL